MSPFRFLHIIITCLFLAQALSGCASLAATLLPSPTAVATRIPAASTATPPPSTPTPLPPTLTPGPTADPGIITTGNAGRLAQIRQLGLGMLVGDPLFTPDGRGLLLLTSTGVYRFDTATYQNPRGIAPTSYASAVALSADGETLAVDNHVYDISGTEVRALLEVEIPADLKAQTSLQSVSFSPDGRLLALEWIRGIMGVYSLADGKMLYLAAGHDHQFSPDGRALVTSADKGCALPDDTRAENPRVCLFDPPTGKLLKEWPGQRAAFLSDGRLALEQGQTTRLYDLSSGRTVQLFDGRFAAFSPDGEVAALYFFGELRLLQVKDRKVLARIPQLIPNPDRVILRFSADGRALAGTMDRTMCCGGYEEQMAVWRVPDGKKLFQKEGGLPVFSPDGQSFLTPDTAYRLSVRSTVDAAERASVEWLSAGVIGLDFLPGSQRLVVATFGAYPSPLEFYQVETGKITSLIPTGINGSDFGLAVSPDGKLVTLGSYFWKTDSGEQLTELTRKMVEHYHFAALGAAFSPDSARVAVGSLNGMLQVWDIAAQSLMMEQPSVCEQNVNSLAFSPDGTRLALTCAAGYDAGMDSVQVWEVKPPGRRVMALTSEMGSFRKVAYSRDGKLIAAVGSEVRVWNAADGKVLFTRPVVDYYLQEEAQSLALTPDGQILAVGWKDGSVELWNIADGQKLVTLLGSRFNPVFGLAFSPDGKLLAVGLDDGAVRLWAVR